MLSPMFPAFAGPARRGKTIHSRKADLPILDINPVLINFSDLCIRRQVALY
jgi:hypothetical protein